MPSFPRNAQNLRLPDTRGMLFESPTDTDWFIGHSVSREIAWGNYSILVTGRAFLEAILLDRNGVNIIFSDQIYISAEQFRGSLQEKDIAFDRFLCYALPISSHELRGEASLR